MPASKPVDPIHIVTAHDVVYDINGEVLSPAQVGFKHVIVLPLSNGNQMAGTVSAIEARGEDDSVSPVLPPIKYSREYLFI